MGCASSKHRQTRRFIEAMESYFLEIRKLLRQTQRRGTSADKNASRAREAEEKRPKGQRLKSRGRVIKGRFIPVTGGKGRMGRVLMVLMMGLEGMVSSMRVCL